MRAALSSRPFRLIFVAQGLSLLGDAMFLVAIAFAVLSVTDSAGALGTVLAVGGVVMTLTLLVSGVWADRLPRVRVMLASDAVRAVSQGTLATVLFTGHATLMWLIVLNAVYMAATAFFHPALTGVIPQILPAEQLVSANGLLVSMRSVTSIAGSALGGVIVAWMGPAAAIGIDALAAAASAVTLLLVGQIPAHVRATVDAQKGSSFRRELREGWAEVRARRWLWMVMLGSAVFLLVYEGPIQVVGPLVMRESYGGAIAWGSMAAALAAGAMIGAIAASSPRIPRPMLTSLVLFFATGIVPLLLMFNVSIFVVVPVLVIVGTSWGLWESIWHAVLQRDVPGDKLARVSAWDWMGALSGLPVGYALGGVATELAGTTPTLVAMSIGVTVVNVAFVLTPSVRRLGDDLPRGKFTS